MRRLAAALIAALAWGAAPMAAAWADDDDGGCWEGECYDRGQDYDQNYGSRDDRNRNRNRNRGAFSPGPFDRSPVDAFNNLCMPGATCTYNPPPDEGEGQR